jgi:hypothetical protein
MEKLLVVMRRTTFVKIILAVIGYDISPGYDLDLIPFTSASDCCRICFERKECVGWTMYEGKCHLKDSNVLVESRDPDNTVSGLKNTVGNEATPVFSKKPLQVQSPKYLNGVKATCNLHNNYKIEGQDLENVGYMYLSECCHTCANTVKFTGWTYHNWECILKKRTELVKSEGDSGIVLENASPDVALPSE